MKAVEQTTIEDAIRVCHKIRKYCIDNEIFFLKLDIDIPDGMLKEAKQLWEEGYYAPRSFDLGYRWYSSAVYGESWHVPEYSKKASSKLNNIDAYYDDVENFIKALQEETNNKNVDIDWTEIAELCPVTTEWLKNALPHDGNYVRCRFMLLDKGGYINPHTDNMSKRSAPHNIFASLNIALNHPEGFYLKRTDTNEEVPFVAGSAFLFDNNVQHEAANLSDIPRFHFLINGGECCIGRLNLYIRSFAKQYPNAII